MSHSSLPLLMLPGLHGSVRLFDDLVRCLREHLPEREFLPLPLPADHAQGYLPLRDHFIAKLEKQGPFALLAESFSTPLALHLAASNRIRVEQLVLVSGFAGPPRGAPFNLLPLRPLFALRPPKAAIRHFLTGNRAPDTLVESIRTEIQASRGGLLAARVRATLALAADELPSPAKVPTLLLQARQDALLPWEVQSALERHLPKAEVSWIDAPHLLLQVAPERSAKAIAKFLR